MTEPTGPPDEPTPGHAADPPEGLPVPGTAGGPRVAVRMAVALLCALLGFALVLQVRRTGSGDALADARPDDLVVLLDGLQHREDALQTEVGDLRDTLGRLRSSGASSAEALAEAQRQAQALGILIGSVPAAGPGVRIVVDDPDGTVPPEVLLDAVEELRNAGAEVLQVGGVRIGVSSAFTGTAGALVLDGEHLASPYTIIAIGDPPTLSAALAVPGGVLDTVRRAGGTMSTAQLDRVVVTAVRQPRRPQYAQPVG